MSKKANKDLPKELQDAINTFIIQSNIAKEYDLDFIPTEYAVNLLTVLSKYPEHSELLNKLIATMMSGIRDEI